MVKLIVILLAMAVFLKGFDRLRQINWQSTKTSYVGMHLSFVLQSLWTLYDAMEGKCLGPMLFGLAGAALWLFVVSHESWVNGPPAYCKRGSGPC
jgi:hypothetical protein